MTEAHADPSLFDAAQFRDAGLPRDLRERFIVPPFSILDAGQGYWRERKRRWIDLGIRSEIGRTDQGEKSFAYHLNDWAREKNVVGAPAESDGTSIFDPVLCELVYRWYAPPAGVVLDPFAGGSVRGVVAGALGRHYVGVELQAGQVAANVEQREALEAEGMFPNGTAPSWIVGDASTDLPDVAADLVFTCPPYGDLERYSDDPRDLSTMSPAAFVDAYDAIVRAAVDRLRDDRFAVFVVGEYRHRGMLLDLPAWTRACFERAGAEYYCKGILATAVATASVRASAQFAGGRKLVRRHQDVLVFVKGRWKKAVAAAEELPPAIDGFVPGANARPGSPRGVNQGGGTEDTE